MIRNPDRNPDLSIRIAGYDSKSGSKSGSEYPDIRTWIRVTEYPVSDILSSWLNKAFFISIPIKESKFN